MSSSNPLPPRLSLGECATLASLWEVTAPKPGNVYRGADFEDVTFADFVTSAAVIGPIFGDAPAGGVGGIVHAAVAATLAAVGTNTNLGMLLLFAPLALVPREQTLARGIADVLKGLTVADAEKVYAAIRLASPGGLGEASEADVNATAPPSITLLEAMRLAADRDLVARQYANDFREVFVLADRIAALSAAGPLGAAIVRAYLELIAEHGDSLVQRKCGAEMSAQLARRAGRVLEAHRQYGEDVYADALADLDFWLRSDGHRRNPGTSADLVAAALFVLLRDQRLHWPVKFY